MVRINIISPRKLADQHLIAEYNEILMLFGYVKKYNAEEGDVPQNYRLGKGHIKFFKNKLTYLKKRHESIKTEMRNRGFKTNKKINLDAFPKNLRNDWKPGNKDYKIIKKRLKEKIKSKPGYYRYNGKTSSANHLIKLLR